MSESLFYNHGIVVSIDRVQNVVGGPDLMRNMTHDQDIYEHISVVSPASLSPAPDEEPVVDGEEGEGTDQGLALGRVQHDLTPGVALLGREADSAEDGELWRES